jgi:hypothetical protein
VLPYLARLAVIAVLCITLIVCGAFSIRIDDDASQKGENNTNIPALAAEITDPKGSRAL